MRDLEALEEPAPGDIPMVIRSDRKKVYKEDEDTISVGQLADDIFKLDS